MVEGSIVHVEVPTSHEADRTLAPHDAAAKGAEGEPQAFSQEFVGDVVRATTCSPKGCDCQTSRSCYSWIGSAPSLGLEADAPSTPDILQVGARRLRPAAIVRHDLKVDLRRKLLGPK